MTRPWSDPGSNPLADIHAFRQDAQDVYDQKPPSDFAALVELELVRGFLQATDDALIGRGHVVTDDEAREALARIRAEAEFEQMMRTFVAQVADRPDGEYRAVMSSEHRNFVRWLQQRNQRHGIYRGGKAPALFGVPVVIDETADRPQLEQM